MPVKQVSGLSETSDFELVSAHRHRRCLKCVHFIKLKIPTPSPKEFALFSDRDFYTFSQSSAEVFKNRESVKYLIG